MKNDFLGIDTSNYTTSAAVYYNGERIEQNKRLLPVKNGQLGLRQSDAVFHHIQQLPLILEPLLQDDVNIKAVGVSDKPRDVAGSYMPCFTVGYGTAKAIAMTLRVPLYTFSHQAGHIAAALYSAEKLELLKEKFLAFHVSGGTTEAVLVTPNTDTVISAKIIASSLDLKGGQAVDRVGSMLGLPFPAGKELEKLALTCEKTFRIKPSMKGTDCSLSGIENHCRKMLDEGFPKEEIAAYCLQSILAALDAMCGLLFREYGELPVVFAGGVMSNSIIRNALTAKYGAYFAAPEFSADNAAGVAVLASMR